MVAYRLGRQRRFHQFGGRGVPCPSFVVILKQREKKPRKIIGKDALADRGRCAAFRRTEKCSREVRPGPQEGN
ncbi:MAG: hypothetical protein CMJ81_21220 [Planctomycetaceae bacterium]|nr:hypothetical protein [Planctomycetaceae bacterium]